MLYFRYLTRIKFLFIVVCWYCMSIPKLWKALVCTMYMPYLNLKSHLSSIDNNQQKYFCYSGDQSSLPRSITHRNSLGVRCGCVFNYCLIFWVFQWKLRCLYCGTYSYWVIIIFIVYCLNFRFYFVIMGSCDCIIGFNILSTSLRILPLCLIASKFIQFDEIMSWMCNIYRGCWEAYERRIDDLGTRFTSVGFGIRYSSFSLDSRALYYPHLPPEIIWIQLLRLITLK